MRRPSSVAVPSTTVTRVHIQLLFVVVGVFFDGSPMHGDVGPNKTKSRRPPFVSKGESDDSIGPGSRCLGEIARPGGASDRGGVGQRAELRGYIQERRGKHKQVAQRIAGLKRGG